MKDMQPDEVQALERINKKDQKDPTRPTSAVGDQAHTRTPGRTPAQRNGTEEPLPAVGKGKVQDSAAIGPRAMEGVMGNMDHTTDNVHNRPDHLRNRPRDGTRGKEVSASKDQIIDAHKDLTADATIGQTISGQGPVISNS